MKPERGQRLGFLGSSLVPWQHRGLIVTFARRELHQRYRQSWLGTAWLLLTPLLMLAVYTLIFRHVLQLRWPGTDGNALAFALRVYAGLAVFNFVAECVGRAPDLVPAQAHLVKKVVFPLEILSWVNLLVALAGLVVSALLLTALVGLTQGGLPSTAVALPLAWLPLLPLCLGLSWMLSAVGTYVRDIGQLVGMVLSALMFLSPVFFPMEGLPTALRPWLAWNPLAPAITATRAVLMQGLWPDWSALAILGLVGLGVAALGAWVFAQLRRGFADVV